MKTALYLVCVMITLNIFNSSCNQQNTYDIDINDGLIITVPKTFIELDSVEIDVKYNSSPYKPNREFIDTETSLKFVVSYGQNPLTDDIISERLQSYEVTFKNRYPNANWMRADVETINSLRTGVIETTDSLNYQLIFFTPVEGKQVYFGLQGNKELMNEIQPVSITILNSLRAKVKQP